MSTKGLLATNVVYICATDVSKGTQYWGAEQVLYKVMKLNNSIDVKSRESGTITQQEMFEFYSSFELHSGPF